VTFAKQAREGSKLFWLMHTDIDPIRYASTTEVARAIEHEAGGEGGLLHVERFPGARAQDHLEALRVDGPPFVRRALEALIARDDTAPTPRDLSVVQTPPILSPFRKAIVDRARAEIGVKESPVNVVEYALITVRGGKWIAVQGLPWCARFASAVIWETWAVLDDPYEPMENQLQIARTWAPSRRAGLPPFSIRAAVSELIADARATGAWYGIHEDEPPYDPLPGDLICYGREGQDPRVGGMGHVAIDVGGGRAISGNLDDQVIEHDHDLSGRGLPVVGWIRVDG
jgi:hypothetical protein